MKTVAKMAFPMFLSAAINFILAFIDTAIVGHLGVQALSATSAGSSLYSIYVQVIGSLIIGLQVLGAQEIVKSGKNQFIDYFQVTISLMYGLAIFFILISLLFYNQLLGLFATPAILGQARLSFFARLPGLLFSPLSWGLKTEYDIQKKTKVGLSYTLFVVVTDLVLDLIFIYGFNWGVWGAGLSDTIAVLAGLLYLIYKNHRDGSTRISEILKLKKWQWRIFKELNQLNIPEVISTLLDYLGNSVLFIVLSRISVRDIAAGRISSTYINIIFTLSINIGTVVQILLARNQVKKQNRQIIRNGFKFATAIIGPLTLIAVLLPQIFIVPFTSDQELIKLLKLPMVLLWIGLLFVPVITITTGILRSQKQNQQNMYVNVLATWALEVPGAFIFCLKLHFGIWGFVLSYLCYFAGRIIGNSFFLLSKKEIVTHD